ncbi:hypothetical protein EW146_g4922 [Bondarzewia mesenterica]|uniref:F-box domain-containing protein n=1 Tax=Bondarzewia mesenterica TaxID=1095465 RepID=A0A4S4LU39_9AGAM|nr:hypothetical protein EW146_g4922 [Bondarzewia mesenterica]
MFSMLSLNPDDLVLHPPWSDLLSGPLAEVSSISGTIRSSEAVVRARARLDEEREHFARCVQVLHARRNQFCPACLLPVEILVNCFKCLSETDLWTVTAVCRRWREVAVECPSLWNENWKYESPQLLELLLARSKPLPIDISWKQSPSHEDEQVEAIRLALTEIYRVRSIKLDGNRDLISKILPFFNTDAETPYLQVLHLQERDDHTLTGSEPFFHPDIPFLSATGLKSVKICDVAVRMNQLRLPNLVQLHIELSYRIVMDAVFSSSTELLEMLGRMVNLQDLYLNIGPPLAPPQLTDPSSFAVDPEVVASLPWLRTFQLVIPHQSAWITQRFILPSDTLLSLIVHNIPAGEASNLWRLVPKSTCGHVQSNAALKTLRLQDHVSGEIVISGSPLVNDRAILANAGFEFIFAFKKDVVPDILMPILIALGFDSLLKAFTLDDVSFLEAMENNWVYPQAPQRLPWRGLSSRLPSIRSIHLRDATTTKLFLEATDPVNVDCNTPDTPGLEELPTSFFPNLRQLSIASRRPDYETQLRLRSGREPHHENSDELVEWAKNRHERAGVNPIQEIAFCDFGDGLLPPYVRNDLAKHVSQICWGGKLHSSADLLDDSLES